MTKPPSLISTIFDLGYSSEEDLGEVQARQVIYGGDQELNLFELGLVTEEQLLTALSRVSGLPSAKVGYLPVDRALTANLQNAGAKAVAGHSESGGVLVFLTAPPDGEELQRISRGVGDTFELVVSTRLRIDEAKAHLQGGALSVREASLLEKFGPRPMVTSSPSEAPGAWSEPPPVWSEPPPGSKNGLLSPPANEIPTFIEEPVVRSVGARTQALSDRPGPQGAETGPPPQDYEEVAVRASLFPKAAASSPPPADKQFPVEQALSLLRQAKTRDRAVEVLVDFASQFFDYSAVFAVLPDEARGLLSAGEGAPPAEVKKLRIPLDLPSAFRKARDTTVHQVTKLRAAGLEGGIARDLDRPTGRDVFLLPIAVRGRTVLLLWGDRGPSGVDLKELGDLFTFAPTMSEVLERVLIERKRASRVAQPAERPAPRPRAAPAAPAEPAATRSSDPLAPPAPAATNPAKAARPPAVSPEGKGGPGPVGPIDEPPPRAPKPPRLPGMPSPDAGAPAPIRRETQRNQAAPPAGLISDSRPPSPVEVEVATHEVAEAPRRQLKSTGQQAPGDSEPPTAFPAEAPKTLRGFPKAQPHPEVRAFAPEAPAVTPQAPQARPPLLSRRIVPLGSQGASKNNSDRPDGKSDAPVAPAISVAPAPPVNAAAPVDAATANHGARASSSEAPAPAALPKADAVDLLEPSRFAPEPRNEPTDIAPPSAQPQVAPEAKLAPPPPPLIAEAQLAPPPPQFDYGGSDDVPRMSAKGTLMSRRPPIIEPDESGWESPGMPPVVRIDSGLGKAVSGLSGKSSGDLVRALLGGDRSALARLAEGGETAVGALIAQFPGPVKEPPSPQTPASECGPILEALALLGTKSIPFLTVRTADEDPKVRRWATFLLGELPGKDSAKAIAERLLDDALEVRRAALASARRARRDIVTRRTLRSHMEGLCRDRQLSADARCAAIEALADIREHEAIPTLLQLLDDSEATVVRASRWALSVLTRQDFGADNTAWRKFWQDNRDLDRVEWLIQSLAHEQRDLRRASGDELTAMAGESFGYQEDLPEAGRRAAQAEFRNWWETVGKLEQKARS